MSVTRYPFRMADGGGLRLVIPAEGAVLRVFALTGANSAPVPAPAAGADL